MITTVMHHASQHWHDGSKRGVERQDIRKISGERMHLFCRQQRENVLNSVTTLGRQWLTRFLWRRWCFFPAYEEAKQRAARQCRLYGRRVYEAFYSHRQGMRER